MFNKENLEIVTERFEKRRLSAEMIAEQNAREAEEKNPELRRVGIQMRGIAVRVLEESMKGGKDLAGRVAKITEENRALQEEYRRILVEMGLPEDHTRPKRKCSLCADTGFVENRMCSCMKREVVLEGYATSGIGKLLKKQRFDNFDLSYYSTALLEDKRYSPRDVMEGIVKEARAYADEFSLQSPSLLFIGGTGLGKTHLSSAIAGVVIEKGFDVAYESAPMVASLFEKARFGKEEGTEEKLERLMEAELLILDDLGTEPNSSTTASAFYQLINHRVSIGEKPTIISTNLTYRQLEKQYDTAILSRLLGEFEVKLFQGEDVRMAKLRG